MQPILNQLKSLHCQLYKTNKANLNCFFAPGRVNLIGEHTDYNGGHVFPAALDCGTYAVVSPRTDQLVRLYSTNFSDMGIIELNLDFPLLPDPKHGWANYPKGMYKIFIDNNYTPLHGLDIVISGNIPNGAGLSSSASIEMLFATILNTTYNFNLAPLTLVKWGQTVENKFIGVSCGIMDQFASMLGKKNQAILLNCNSLDYTYAPLNLDKYCIIIVNTKKQRSLAESKYNERCYECERALQQLQQKLAIKNLCDLDTDTFIEHEHLITNPLHQLRAKHVVMENQRTMTAASALKANDLNQFGKLMAESHISLRNNYEVTGLELDTMVEAAWAEPGCIGSRMTGAGFGGCTVNLVANDAVDNFIHNVGHTYTQRTSLIPEFYIANIGAGATIL